MVTQIVLDEPSVRFVTARLSQMPSLRGKMMGSTTRAQRQAAPTIIVQNFRNSEVV